MRRIWAGAIAALAAASLVSLPPAAAAAPSAAGCSLTSTNGTVERTAGGGTYRLNVPPGLTADRVPLLISLHGGSVTAEQYETWPLLSPGWTEYAARKHFIVAYPQGPGQFWNDYSAGSPNVAFIRAVVADIADDYCVNPRRIYADGHSNGSFMSQRLACDAADLFAAVAEYAGGDVTVGVPPNLGAKCTPSRPIPMGLFHGVLDPTSSPPVAWHLRAQWLERLSCPSTGEREPGVLVEAIRYGPCDGGVEVIWRLTLNSHDWPSGTAGENQRNRIWALFERNPMPS